MRNKSIDHDRLAHIKESTEFIEQFTKDVTYEQYIKDYKLRLALVKLLEFIGEASSGITKETHKKFAAGEWNIIEEINCILMYEYSGIDYDKIWNAIKNQVPKLKEAIAKILE
jgi:uncharacterized protein with HEPN domain